MYIPENQKGKIKSISFKKEIQELRRGTKRPQCNFDFTSYFEGRYNTDFIQVYHVKRQEGNRFLDQA